MARSTQKKQKQKQRKLRQRSRKQLKKKHWLAESCVPEPSAKIAREIEKFHDYFDEGDIDLAIELSSELSRTYPKCAAVALLEIIIGEHLEDRHASCMAAKRLLGLVPKNPDALFLYARASMYCSRVAIAYLHFRKFLKWFPNYEYADRASTLCLHCELESRKLVSLANADWGLELDFDHGGLEFFARHEESIELMNNRDFSSLIELLKQIIEEQPSFMPSQNNLVTALFHQGHYENALRTAREICQLNPDNRFSEASLIQMEFLTGNPDRANELADRMIVDPPIEATSFAAMILAFGFLGRDEDLVVLSQKMRRVSKLDRRMAALVIHHFAVANYRLGDEKEACNLWDKCLKIDPQQSNALQNLADIFSKGRQSAWYQAVDRWLPYAFMEPILESNNFWIDEDVSRNRIIASLVPALLERGDPAAREFAFEFAREKPTPPMLAALMDFAFSTRGPDSVRRETLTILKKHSVIDAGPHRFFAQEKWVQIQLNDFTIKDRPADVEPWSIELLQKGYWELHGGDLEDAERTFLRVLDRDPNCCTARFNLASVWIKRERGDDLEKADREIRKIHALHPNYLFAAMFVAITAAESGNLEYAKSMIGKTYEKPEMNFTEALALFSARIQIALLDNDVAAAETAWNQMCQVVDEYDAVAVEHRQKIDAHIETQMAPRSLERGLIRSLLGSK